MFLDLQIEYLLWLQNIRELANGFFDLFFLAVTHFGEFLIPIAFMTLIYWSLNKKAGEFLIMAHAFSIICNQFVKMLACIERPWILSDKIKPVADAIPEANGYSFPSGHTAKAAATWGGLAVWFWDNKKIRYSMLILVLLIAFSRNYLGVHTLQDVLVSLGLCAAILFVFKKIFDNMNSDNNSDMKLFTVSIILTIITVGAVIFKYFHLDGQKFLSYVSQMPSAYFYTGYSAGIFSGWIACRKLIPFETYGISWLKRILRFVFGFSILLIILFQGKEILISDFGECRGNFICAFVFGVFLTFFYPWIFTKAEKFLNSIRQKNIKE